MSQATKNKTTASGELREVESERDRLKEQVTSLRHEHFDTAKATEELQTQRRRLAAREPGLVDHNDQPVGEDENPVAVLDAKIGKLPNPADLYAKVQHSQRLEQVADAKVREFIELHRAELLAEFTRQEAGAAAAEWASASAALQAAGERLHAVDHRRHQLGAESSEGLVNAVHDVVARLEGIHPDA